jgi:hypothetical protein
LSKTKIVLAWVKSSQQAHDEQKKRERRERNKERDIKETKIIKPKYN